VEIQLRVLSSCFILRFPIDFEFHDRRSRLFLLPIALANKHLHNLANEIYYGENTFIIQRCLYREDIHGQVTPHYKVLRYPNPKIAHRVRKLQLYFRANLGRLSDEVLCLFHPHEAIYSSPLFRNTTRTVKTPGTEWQIHFQHLREIRIMLGGDRECVSGGGQEAIDLIMQRSVMNFRARHVKVFIWATHQDIEPREGCDGLCIERLAMTLIEMIKTREERQEIAEEFVAL
jgi:hypothetical protein